MKMSRGAWFSLLLVTVLLFPAEDAAVLGAFISLRVDTIAVKSTVYLKDVTYEHEVSPILWLPTAKGREDYSVVFQFSSITFDQSSEPELELRTVMSYHICYKKFTTLNTRSVVSQGRVHGGHRSMG